MTKRDKMLRRFQSKPRDFAWTELVGLLEGFGYRTAASGKKVEELLKSEGLI